SSSPTTCPTRCSSATGPCCSTTASSWPTARRPSCCPTPTCCGPTGSSSPTASTPPSWPRTCELPFLPFLPFLLVLPLLPFLPFLGRRRFLRTQAVAQQPF